MNKKPYIISIVSFNDEKKICLVWNSTISLYTVLAASSFEELMILIDLNSYDRNEIEFPDIFKAYA